MMDESHITFFSKITNFQLGGFGNSFIVPPCQVCGYNGPKYSGVYNGDDAQYIVRGAIVPICYQCYNEYLCISRDRKLNQILSK